MWTVLQKYLGSYDLMQNFHLHLHINKNGFGVQLSEKHSVHYVLDSYMNIMNLYVFCRDYVNLKFYKIDNKSYKSLVVS